MNTAIQNRYITLAEVRKEIEYLQTACTHPDETLYKVLDASTGNYDPSSNGYWANFRCYQCGKSWRVDPDDGPEQDREYRFRGTKVKDWPKDQYWPF